jgi:hydrophobe/amphiphile efflux-3 (HAE3) family protein
MFERLIDGFADTITRRRKVVLGCVVLFVAFCAAQLPRLQTDSSPENLIISFGNYQERVREFRGYFGDTDSVIVILVRADDVTALPVLSYIHAISHHFQTESEVARVESLTVTPLPGAFVEDDGATLEDLDDLGDPEVDPEDERALETLIASAPERFPLGLLTVGERVGQGNDLRGVVRGAEVTPAEADAIRRVLENAPLVEGRLVSRDHTLAAVAMVLDPELGTGARRLSFVHEVDAWLAANPPPPEVTIHTAGLPHLRASISDAMLEDQTVLVPLSLLVCVLILFASFRWIAGTLLPLLTVAFSVVIVLGLMALVGEPLTILMNTLPTLMIVMGISEAVHVLGRYAEESARTPDRIAAARRVIRTLAIACFLTSFTTAVGFASLTVAQTEMLRRFGAVAGVGVMISFVILMTFVPAAMTFFGPPRPAPHHAEATPHDWIEKFLVPMTTRITRRPWLVIIGTVLVTIPCGIAYRAVRVDTSLRDTFDPDDPVVVSVRLIEEHLDGIRPLEVHVSADEEGRLRDPEVIAALDRVAAWARTQDGVLRVTSPSVYLHESWRRIAGIESGTPEEPFASRAQVEALDTLIGRLEPNPLDSYRTPDGRHMRLEIRLADIGAQRSIRLIDAVSARLEAELAPFPDVHTQILGEAYIGSHGVDAVVQDMFGSLSLSALVIFLVIALLFRSARIGLISIPPNVVPQLGTIAWMVVRGIPLNASTAIVFSVAIGTTVDFTIHAVSRFIEEQDRGLNRRAAILRAARGTGRSIVVSSSTVVLGFAVLLFSGFVPVRQFGELIAAALTLSLVSTLGFLPAILMVFGPKPKTPRAS